MGEDRHRRDQLDRLIRYTARGAISLIVWRKHPWGSPLHLHSAWVGWHDGDQTLSDLERCPRCHPCALRLIAALTWRPVIRRILGHLKLAAAPPPLAPARLEQGWFAWTWV